MHAVLRRQRAGFRPELLKRIGERQRKIQVVVRIVVRGSIQDVRDTEGQPAGHRIGQSALHAPAGRIQQRLRHGRG